MIRDEIGFILNPKFAYLFQNNLKVAGWPRTFFTNSVTDARNDLVMSHCLLACGFHFSMIPHVIISC